MFECVQRISEIVVYPNGAALYLSGLSAYENPADFHFQTIVSMISADSVPMLPPSYHQFILPILDNPSEEISKYFDASYTILLSALLRGDRVLVHCRAGVSRSVTILIAFLLRTFRDGLERKFVLPYVKKTHGTWTDSILAYIQSRRWCAQPNDGFMRQLYAYETYCVRNVF